MSIERGEFEDVCEADLLELIDGQVQENERLEYKRDLYGNSREEKREFLKDVSALANSNGGHLIIGIGERKGVASSLQPISASPESASIRMEQMARDGLDPKISGLRIKSVEISTGGYVFVIRIPRSWNPPHRVVANGSNRFYMRNSNFVHEPNLEELRSLFSQSSSALELAKNFRKERLEYIQQREGVRPLSDGGRFILHIVPIASFSATFSLNLEEVFKHHRKFPIIGTGGSNPRYNYYGLLNQLNGEVNNGYTQIFRSGILEATKAQICREIQSGTAISAQGLESGFFQVYSCYLDGLKSLGVPPPLVVMITLEGVRGSNYITDEKAFMDVHSDAFPESALLLPECILEDYGETKDQQKAVRPAFDTLWNATGRSKSTFFNEDGIWEGPNAGFR